MLNDAPKGRSGSILGDWPDPARNGPFWPNTAQIGPKCRRNGYVSRMVLQGPNPGFRGRNPWFPHDCPKSPQMAQNGPFGSSWAHNPDPAQNGPEWPILAKYGPNRPKMPSKWLCFPHGSAGAESGLPGPNPWFPQDDPICTKRVILGSWADPAQMAHSGPFWPRIGPKCRINGSLSGMVLQGPNPGFRGRIHGFPRMAHLSILSSHAPKPISGPDRPRTPDWAYWEQACPGHGLRRPNPGFRPCEPGKPIWASWAPKARKPGSGPNGPFGPLEAPYGPK